MWGFFCLKYIQITFITDLTIKLNSIILFKSYINKKKKV